MRNSKLMKLIWTVCGIMAFSPIISAQHVQSGPLKNTIINPLPIPEYQLGNWDTKPTRDMDRWLKG